MIKKLVYSFFSVLLLTLSIPAVELPEIMKPSTICIADSKLYIIDGSEVHFYTMTGEHLGKFGKKGEGPGEFVSTLYYPNKIAATKDKLLVESLNKISYFTFKGKFIKDIKKPVVLNNVTIAGKNFVARKVIQSTQKDSKSTVSIYDSKFNKIKDLYEQNFPQQNHDGKRKLDLGQDFLMFVVHDNKIFVERSPEGLLFDVFDFSGNKLYTIGDGSKGTIVNDSMKAVLENRLRYDPQIQKQMTQRKRTWKDMKKNMKLVFPENLPAVQNFYIAGNRIFVQNSLVKEGEAHFVIMDLKGQQIAEKKMKVYEPASFMAKLMGIKFSVCKGNNIYYIQENEDTETWELHKSALL